ESISAQIDVSAKEERQLQQNTNGKFRRQLEAFEWVLTGADVTHRSIDVGSREGVIRHRVAGQVNYGEIPLELKAAPVAPDADISFDGKKGALSDLRLRMHIS